MSSQITTAHVLAYEAGVRHLQQQKQHRFAGCVTVSNMIKKRMAFDQLDSVELQEITGRHADTALTDSEHRRRWVSATEGGIADMLDTADKVRAFNEFQGPYAQAFVMAANRYKDDKVIDAFTATATTGELGDGSSTAAFDTSNFQIATGSKDMTLAKILEARKILEENENDPDQLWCIVMGARQRQSLLSDPEVTSSDYAAIKALVNGEINSYVGFRFVNSERLPLATNTRSCYAWCYGSMKLGINYDVQTIVSQRPDKWNNTQVATRIMCGATRMDEKGVVEILCDESAAVGP